MKKVATIIIVCLMIFAVCVGCGKQKAEEKQTTAIGNPWSDWTSIEEAETAVGFSFELPEVIAECYTAVAFRTLNNELIEIIYRDSDREICVRKQKGEGQDISGDYNQYDTCTEETIGEGTITYYANSGDHAVKQLISYKGFSWSLVANNGDWMDGNWNFASEVFKQ